MKPHTLVIDGYNFMHRSRSGFKLGPKPVVFNFFRSLRALIEAQKPTDVVFVIEGEPTARLALNENYKANRIIDIDAEPEKHRDMIKFHEQKQDIISMLQDNFPITVVRHINHECDDVIHNLIKHSSRDVPITVVSNDTDFIQLLQEFNHVKLYNPMTKKYVEAPEYPYVSWKSLRGDPSDNIPGIPGIGDKTAVKILTEEKGEEKFFQHSKLGVDRQKQYNANYNLIKFIDFTEDEMKEIQLSSSIRNWQQIKNYFDQYKFNSITNPKSWDKFVRTFDYLFEV